MIAETKRLKIRQLTQRDAGFAYQLMNDPAWLQNIGDRGVRSIADAGSYIESKMIQMYEALGFGMYLVEIKATSAPIGFCGLVKREALAAPDIGFALMPQFRGNGYAHEAARAVMRHSEEQLGLARLFAIVAPGNQRSSTLLQRLGFVHEGGFRADPNEIELELYAVVFSR
jgi:ribosomal-protein-alanine N-acetyltransferase